MLVVSSLLELAGLALIGTALYHLGGLWLVVLAAGLLLTAIGYSLGRPASADVAT